MRAIVTRPAAQAQAWVQRLGTRGVEALALPLIAIGAAPEPQRVADAWASLGRRALVVFVSPNAVDAFFRHRPEGVAWPATTRAASVGPGTTRALIDSGVPSALVAAAPDDASQFDSEALWQVLADDAWPGREVLIVRGDGGRDWLADRLREAGALVEHLAAYRREAPRLDAAQRAVLDAALATPREWVWLFSSSEAIDNLEQLAGGPDWRGARAVATHPRIAARARGLGVGDVRDARPDLDAVVACIESFEHAPLP